MTYKDINTFCDLIEGLYVLFYRGWSRWYGMVVYYITLFVTKYKTRVLFTLQRIPTSAFRLYHDFS